MLNNLAHALPKIISGEHFPNLESIENARILVVDDNEMDQLIVSSLLQRNRFNQIRICSNGLEALEECALWQPDLVILDLHMPVVDGFEFLTRVGNTHNLMHMPVIALTMTSEIAAKAKIFQLGACDFITKPVHVSELNARTRMHLERKFLIQALDDYHSRIAGEMQIAQQMQRQILPSPTDVQVAEHKYDVNIAHHYTPSSELGGDHWGLCPISDTRVGIYMIDFSGHGVSAAINTFRIHLLLHKTLREVDDAGMLLRTLNQMLREILSAGEFATMFYGILDTQKHRLEYACAAVPHPLHITKSGQQVVPLLGHGLPLGVLADASYPVHTTHFFPGDALLLYSDALIESPTKQNTMIDEATIAKLLSDSLSDGMANHATTLRTMQRLVGYFAAHCPGALRDDLTMMLLQRNGATTPL